MPFFRAHGVAVAANDRSTPLDIVFNADNASYDFAIAFDYTFQNDDRKYTQTLLNGDQPWRVTGSACRTDRNRVTRRTSRACAMSSCGTWRMSTTST